MWPMTDRRWPWEQGSVGVLGRVRAMAKGGIMPVWVVLSAAVFGLFCLMLLQVQFFKAMYRKPPPGHAMVVKTMKPDPKITMTGAVVVPTLHAMHLIDLRSRLLTRHGSQVLVEFSAEPNKIAALDQKIGGYDIERANEVLTSLVETCDAEELASCGIVVRDGARLPG
jgi:hypothetical protein